MQLSYGTLSSQLRWFWNGVEDSFRWSTVLSVMYNDIEIRQNILKSVVMNSLCLISIYALDLVLLPLILHLRPLQGPPNWFHENAGQFYQVLWLMPVVGVSFYLNGAWYQTIAKRTYTLKHGAWTSQDLPSTGLLASIFTSMYRTVMISTCLLCAMTISFVPVGGRLASFAYLCWIDSYFCFEFIWIAQGLTLTKRITFVEERLAYFLGFGIAPTALCNFSSSLTNTVLFALIFPSYIILAMHAKPHPSEPSFTTPERHSHLKHRPSHLRLHSQFINYNPLDESPSIHARSPVAVARFPVFGVALWLSDQIIRAMNIAVGGRIATRQDEGIDVAIEEGAAISLSPLKSAQLRYPFKAGPKMD